MLPDVHEDSPPVVVSTMEKSLTPRGTVEDMGTGSAKLEPGSFWKVAGPAVLVGGQLVSVVLNAPDHSGGLRLLPTGGPRRHACRLGWHVLGPSI